MQPFTFSPLIAQLASSRRILLAGCGGGSDVFGALPIYFGLQRAFAAMMAGSSSGDAPEIFLASLTSADEKDVIKHPSKRHGIAHIISYHRIMMMMTMGVTQVII